jgi:hypothetical protein
MGQLACFVAFGVMNVDAVSAIAGLFSFGKLAVPAICHCGEI